MTQQQGYLPRRSWGRTSRSRAVTAVAILVVVLLAIAGCAAIPTSGPVGKSTPLAAEKDSPNIELQQYGPEANVTPENLITGFINSGTGVDNDFQTAREFLTASLGQTWSPAKRILVYKNYTISPGTVRDTYRIKFSVVSTLDSTGLLTPAPANAIEAVDMSVVQVDGQWRIDKAPDGVMLRQGEFKTLYTPVSLYFYDPTFTFAVPDVRWFPRRNSKTVTAIVQAMLKGPAPYLKGAVVSAFPTGMGLELDTVPVERSIATVALTSQLLLDTKVRERQQMHAQLLLTLKKALDNVTGVQFMAGNRLVEMGDDPGSAPPLVVDNVAPSTEVAIAKNELVTSDGTTVSAIPKLGSVAAYAPQTPAISYSGDEFAFLTGDNTKVFRVTPGKTPELAASGVNMTPPSFAPNGTLWSAEGNGSGKIQIFGAGSKPSRSSIEVPWLIGATVNSFRVSRDGTRALVVYVMNGVSHAAMTGITRSDNTVGSLTNPIKLTTSLNPILGVWVGETSVAVLGTGEGETEAIQLLDLTADAVTLSPLANVEWISAGSRDRYVHAQTGSETFAYVGNSWVPGAQGMKQASFAG